MRGREARREAGTVTNVSIEDARRAEPGTTSIHELDFEVTPGKSPKEGVSVDYATSAGTAEAGMDYKAVNARCGSSPERPTGASWWTYCRTTMRTRARRPSF